MLRIAVAVIAGIEFVFIIYYAAVGSNIEVLHHNDQYFIATRMMLIFLSSVIVLRSRIPFIIIFASIAITSVLAYEFICLQTFADLEPCRDCTPIPENILESNIQHVVLFLLIPNFFIFQLVGKQIDLLRSR